MTDGAASVLASIDSVLADEPGGDAMRWLPPPRATEDAMLHAVAAAKALGTAAKELAAVVAIVARPVVTSLAELERTTRPAPPWTYDPAPRRRTRRLR